jgi:hypothetical protein
LIEGEYTMKHDYSGLNNAQRQHVKHFIGRLSHWRLQRLSDETCFRIARDDTQRKYPLKDEEGARMDVYIATRF